MARERQDTPPIPLTGDEFAPESQARPGRWLPMSSSRVTQARYDSGLSQVQVIFRDGTPWTYDGVPQNIWRNFRRSSSPGRYVNSVLNSFPYWEGAGNEQGDDDNL